MGDDEVGELEASTQQFLFSVHLPSSLQTLTAPTLHRKKQLNPGPTQIPFFTMA
jgi:hypothetical protein